MVETSERPPLVIGSSTKGWERFRTNGMIHSTNQPWFMPPRWCNETPLAFIAHRPSDHVLARSLAESLNARGFAVVLYDPNALWESPIHTIVPAIQCCDLFVIASADESASEWLRSEGAFAKAYRAKTVRSPTAFGLARAAASARCRHAVTTLLGRAIAACYPHLTGILACALLLLASVYVVLAYIHFQSVAAALAGAALCLFVSGVLLELTLGRFFSPDRFQGAVLRQRDLVVSLFLGKFPERAPSSDGWDIEALLWERFGGALPPGYEGVQYGSEHETAATRFSKPIPPGYLTSIFVSVPLASLLAVAALATFLVARFIQ